MTTPYQRIFSRLDVSEAINKTTRNDLLPQRPEDRVRGELGNRFSEYLVRNIERGDYDPLPSYSVAVPKSRLTTRPAALLSFSDRVVYEAIVAILRPRIEKFLLGSGIVFWPRGNESDKRWREFEASVKTPSCRYVVRADIAGFYESVNHEDLADCVVAATGHRDVADALSDFLGRVMNSHRGLPQGLPPSDSLSTLYLAEVDFAMVRHNFQYVRHGDDIRISAGTYDEGCKAVRALEATLRQHGLLLNVEKTRVLRLDTYNEQVSRHSTVLKSTRSRIVNNRIKQLRDDESALQSAIDDSGMEQLGWDLFYHGTVDIEDVIEELRPTIQPSEVEIAETLFRDAYSKRPGTIEALPREVFHQQLTYSLVRLAAGRSTGGVRLSANIVRSFPDKVETVCSYLNALSSVPDAAADVVQQMEMALFTQESESDLAWIVRVLDRFRASISSKTRAFLHRTIQSPHGRWLAAAEAAKLIAGVGELEHGVLLRMWDTCPAVLRSDLVEAGARMAKTAQWAKAFVSGVQSDPVNRVVADHELLSGR